MGGATQKFEVAVRFNGIGFMPFFDGGGAVELVVAVVVVVVVVKVLVEVDDVAFGDRDRFRD